MSAIPMIHFTDAKCKEALSFYEKVFDTKVGQVITFEMAKEKVKPEVMEQLKDNMPADDSVFLAVMDITGQEFYFSDLLNAHDAGKDGGKLSIVLRDTDGDKIEKWWNRLSEGALVTQPLGPTFWTDKFGALIDQYGIHWSLTFRQHFYAM